MRRRARPNAPASCRPIRVSRRATDDGIRRLGRFRLAARRWRHAHALASVLVVPGRSPSTCRKSPAGSSATAPPITAWRTAWPTISTSTTAAKISTRVWREYPTGPEGVFLKRGRDVQGISVTGALPFVAARHRRRLGPASGCITRRRTSFRCLRRRSSGCSARNGFLVLHALLMTICFACAYAFLVARSAPVPALIFAAAFLLVSVVPVYIVQFMPDFFNLAVVLIGYFFWCYKEAHCRGHGRRSRAMARDLASWPALGHHRRRAARYRDVFQADDHAGDGAAAAVLCRAAAVAARADLGTVCSGRSWSACLP